MGAFPEEGKAEPRTPTQPVLRTGGDTGPTTDMQGRTIRGTQGAGFLESCLFYVTTLGSSPAPPTPPAVLWTNRLGASACAWSQGPSQPPSQKDSRGKRAHSGKAVNSVTEPLCTFTCCLSALRPP